MADGIFDPGIFDPGIFDTGEGEIVRTAADSVSSVSEAVERTATMARTQADSLSSLSESVTATVIPPGGEVTFQAIIIV